MYDSKYYKVLRFACCDMQSEDDVAQMFIWENLNSIMSKNGMLNVNFKDFMANNA